jgi:aquaporin Z
MGRLAWRDMLATSPPSWRGGIRHRPGGAGGLIWPRWAGVVARHAFFRDPAVGVGAAGLGFHGRNLHHGAADRQPAVHGGTARLRWVTPLVAGPLFFMLNPFEAWLSGDSTNLARSLGPALFSGQWRGFWIYGLAPFAGVALMVGLVRLGILGAIELHEARLAHFGHHGRAPYLLPWRRPGRG